MLVLPGFKQQTLQGPEAVRVSHKNREFLPPKLALQSSCRTVDLFPFARHSAKLNVYGRKFQVYEKTAELSRVLEAGQKR